MSRLIGIGIGLVTMLNGGCSKIAGLDEYRVGASSGTSFDFVDAQCGSCMKANCSTPLDACRSDPLCGYWEDCTAKCAPGNTDCEHDCLVKAGATNAAVSDVWVCNQASCLDACKQNAFAAAQSSECGSTALGSCLTSTQACAADSECRSFFKCLLADNCALPSGGDAGTAIPNPNCIWSCGDPSDLYAPRPTAESSVTTNPTLNVALCSYTQSYQLCGFDDLSCIGRYDWSAATADNIRVTFFANDSGLPEVAGTPIANASIRACPQTFSTATCTLPVGPVSTDSQGLASLSLPTLRLGQDWYFEVTPPWLNGPLKILFNSGRKLNQDTTLPLALNAATFFNGQDPSYGFANAPWQRDKAALVAFTRSCSSGLAAGLTVSLDDSDGGVGPTPLYGAAAGGTVSAPCGLAPVGASCPSLTVSAWFSGIEPGFVTVSAWDGDTLIAREQVVTEADSITILNWFYPLGGGVNP